MDYPDKNWRWIKLKIRINNNPLITFFNGKIDFVFRDSEDDWKAFMQTLIRIANNGIMYT